MRFVFFVLCVLAVVFVPNTSEYVIFGLICFCVLLLVFPHMSDEHKDEILGSKGHRYHNGKRTDNDGFDFVK